MRSRGDGETDHLAAPGIGRVHYWRGFSALRMLLGGIGGSHRLHTGDSDDLRSAWSPYIVPTHIEDLLELVPDDRSA